MITTSPLPNVFLIHLQASSTPNGKTFEEQLFAATRHFVLPHCPHVSPAMFAHHLMRDKHGEYLWQIVLENVDVAEQDATTAQTLEENVRTEIEQRIAGIGNIRSFSALSNLVIPGPHIDIPIASNDNLEISSFGSEEAPWFDYATDSGTTHAGKELPASLLARIAEVRSDVPSEPNLKPHGKGHVYYALEDKAHRAWIREWLDAKMAVANEADKRKIRAFGAFQTREGTTASMNTYDSQIVTWGTGWGGLGWLGAVMTRATANPTVRAKLEQAGVRYRSRNTYDIVDLATKRVITGKQEALEVMRASLPLLNLLIQLARNPETRQAVADAQLGTFFISAGDVSLAQEMATQALFNLVAHLKHWAPGYATGCLEWALPQLPGQTKSADRDKLLAPLVGKYFYGKARGKAWTPDWKQFQGYWQHMKEDGLDCLSDPFIRASNYPTNDPFVATTSSPAPSTPSTPATTPAPRPAPTSTTNTSNGSNQTNPAPAPVLRHPLLASIEQLETVARGKTLLRRGDQGAGVRAVQQVLLNSGFQLPAGANGIFDEFMVDATKAFQRKHGLKDDGIIGSMTIRKLDAADSTGSAK